MKRLRSGTGRFSSSEAFSLFLRLFRFEFLLALENGCMYLYSCKYENLPLNARKPRLYRGFSSVHLFHALKMVPVVGLEPTRVISPTDFESVTSANSITPAFIFLSLTPDGASEKSEVHRGGTLKITYILNCQISLKNQGFRPKW